MAYKETSLLTYIGITNDGTATTMRGRVFKAIQSNPGYTRAELAQLTGIKINSLTGRVNELLQVNDAIYEKPMRQCNVTGRLAHPLKAHGVAPSQIVAVDHRPTIKQVEKRLEVAVKALKAIASTPSYLQNNQAVAEHALREITEGDSK